MTHQRACLQEVLHFKMKHYLYRWSEAETHSTGHKNTGLVNVEGSALKMPDPGDPGERPR